MLKVHNYVASPVQLMCSVAAWSKIIREFAKTDTTDLAIAMHYTVGTYRIDVGGCQVSRGDTIVPVEPKVFDLLIFLIENRRRVVPKDELVDQIWNGRAISDAALSSCIQSARRVLDDDGRQQLLIRTVHRRGFRFVGAVEVSGQASLSEHGFALQPANSGRAPPLAPVKTDAIGPDNPICDVDLSLPHRPSIAVLPLQPMGSEQDQALMATGLTHDITVRLARTRWLFVAAGASARKVHEGGFDIIEIGRQLGVRYLLSGSLMVTDRRMRISMKLSDIAQGCEIWAERLDRTIDDIFAVQDEIGDLVVTAVESEIERRERRQSLLRPLASLDAWSAYHRANDHLYRYTPEHGEQAERLLTIAARLDPNSARVQASLSFVHWQRVFLKGACNRQDEVQKALDHARLSISLDPLDPQGHWAFGRAMLFEGDMAMAVEELQKAVNLNPNFAVGRYSLAYGLGFVSHRDGAFDHLAKARRLSPYDPMTYAFMAQRAILHAYDGEADEAATWSARAVRQPYAHHHILAIAAWCHELAKQHDEALGYLSQLRSVRPSYTRADYFLALPYQEGSEQRALLDSTFEALGL